LIVIIAKSTTYLDALSFPLGERERERERVGYLFNVSIIVVDLMRGTYVQGHQLSLMPIAVVVADG